MKTEHGFEEHLDADIMFGREIWVNKFTEESAQKFRLQVMDRANRDPSMVIPIYIDSYGGYVDSLAKMLEVMNEVPNQFLTICQGKAMSCGAILLSHGDIRFCGKYSRVMIHNVSGGSWGDVYTMKADSAEGMRLNERFMGLLAENCKITYKELQEKIKEAVGCKEIWLNAEDAKKFGIIDHVGTPLLVPEVRWGCALAPEKREQPASTSTKKEAKAKAKTSSKAKMTKKKKKK